MLEFHRIIAYDTGADWMKPARWIAQPDPRWLGTDRRLVAYGSTRELAVSEVRRKLRSVYPEQSWIASVPDVDETY